jgi:hypothetical protein
MPHDPTPGRDRARRPYSHDTSLPRPGGHRRHRVDEGPTLFDPPAAPAPPPATALQLRATLHWIDYAILPEPAGYETGTARLWRLEAPGCPDVRVAELADPEDPTGACDPRYRGLWCSCEVFARHLGCGHVEDLAAAGLLRPDLADWDDLDDLAAAWDFSDLDAEGGAL